MRQSEQPGALQASHVSSHLLHSQGLLSLRWVQGCSAGSPVVPIFPLTLYMDSRSESSKQRLLSCGLMEGSWRIRAPEHPTEDMREAGRSQPHFSFSCHSTAQEQGLQPPFHPWGSGRQTNLRCCAGVSLPFGCEAQELSDVGSHAF